MVDYKKKFFFLILIFFFLIFFLEIVSFIFTKFSLFSYNNIPKIYASKYLSNDDLRNELYPWGAWRKKNKESYHSTKCFDVIYKTNLDGARDDNFFYNNNDDNNFILLGDSFAEGWGVKKENTFEKLVEKEFNIKVFNLGSAYNFGPVQYFLIYKEYSKKLNFNTKIIFFLPSNDFKDNDYKYWKESGELYFDLKKRYSRYRPYIKDDKGNFFYDKNSIKRNSFTQTFSNSSFENKIKNFLKNNFWLSNLIIECKILLKKIKNFSKTNNNNFYSGYFDESEKTQREVIVFIEKIINYDNKKTFLISIPSISDIKKNKSNIEKPYWITKLKKIDKENKNFSFIDLLENFNMKNPKKIFNNCDGHWNKIGHRWAFENFMRVYLNR